MTKMTVNGVTTTKTPGQEQFEKYQTTVGRKRHTRISYDYRALDGELFACDCKTLEECRQKRDNWLDKKAAAAA